MFALCCQPGRSDHGLVGAMGQGYPRSFVEDRGTRVRPYNLTLGAFQAPYRERAINKSKIRRLMKLQ